MDKTQIHKLLQRYLKGECDIYEEHKIHRWYNRLRKSEDITLSDEERILLEDKLWKNIHTGLEIDGAFPKTKQRPVWLNLVSRAGVAAALLVAVGLAWYFFSVEKPRQVPTQQVVAFSDKILKVNESDAPIDVTLGDGSRISLSAGSSLEYPREFSAEKREVTLSGDAFFEITSRSGQPFLVHNGKLTTQVLGTSFWIRTHQKNKSLEVEVLTGKVSVFENAKTDGNSIPEATSVKTQNGVVLTPNQRVTYYPDNGYLLTSIVHEPIPIYVPDTIELIFDNEEVNDIVPQLFRKFGIEILLANEELGKCTFTGDINGLLLYDALELVCKSVGAKYEIKGTRILIDGTGCD